MTSELSRTVDELITEYVFSAPLTEVWVLVEGESDVAFLWEYRTERNCIIIDMQGKSEIIDALSAQVMRGQRGIVGIVDADYWLILQPQKLKMDSILCDEDFPDLEVILMSSRALKKSLRHDIRAMPNCTVAIARIEDFADRLATQAFLFGMEFGYFRLLNDCEKYGINFNSFWETHQLDEFIDKQKLAIELEWFARRLVAHHKARWPKKPDRWIPYEVLQDGVNELKELYPMPNTKLCRGKDVVAVAEFIGPSLFESEFANELSPQQMSQFSFDYLSTELRKCYEYIYFVETSLFKRIRKWESQSGDFRIIRDVASA